MVSFAVGLPNVGEFGDPAVLLELGVAAEGAGWDGVFVWDHLLYREADWPVANPTVVVAGIAARTNRVRVGVLINAVARRRVAQLALETATLDVLSGGRAVFGAGLGSYPDEWSRLGEDDDPVLRARRLDEGLEVITALWSGTEVSYRGDEVTVDAVRMPLRPVQRPRVPVWIGGRWPARRPFRRAARWDGVMPTHDAYGFGETMSPAELAEVVGYVRQHRDPAAAPLDVVLEGWTKPGDSVGRWAELTWWVEALGWWRGGVTEARRRIEAGPPTA